MKNGMTGTHSDAHEITVTLKSILYSAFKKSLTILAAAVLLAFIVSKINSPAYIAMAETLHHHSCTTTGAFPVLSLGLVCVSVLVMQSPIFEKICYVSSIVSDLLGHLTLAGLGFAIVFWDNNFQVFETYFVGFGWLLIGALCIVQSKLIGSTIEPYNAVGWKHKFIAFLMWSIVAVGFLTLYLGVEEGAQIKPSLNCLSKHK